MKITTNRGKSRVEFWIKTEVKERFRQECSKKGLNITEMLKRMIEGVIEDGQN